MSAIDLTEAVEAGSRARWEEIYGERSWERALAESPVSVHNMREGVLTILTAAAPLIERAVREQVAREILDDGHAAICLSIKPDGECICGVDASARIARGDS